MDGLSFFDLIIIITILILGIKGVINGFIKEAFGLVGIIAGVFVASRYGDNFGNFISSKIYEIPNEISSNLVGFIVLFLLIWILSISLGFILEKMISISGLSTVDKILGFIVGVLKIFLVFSIFFALLSKIEFIKTKLDRSLKNSFMYPAFIEAGNFIIKVEPIKVLNESIEIDMNSVEDIKKSVIKIFDKNKTDEVN